MCGGVPGHVGNHGGLALCLDFYFFQATYSPEVTAKRERESEAFLIRLHQRPQGAVVQVSRDFLTPALGLVSLVCGKFLSWLKWSLWLGGEEPAHG